MNTFSVADIATMLEVNEESVRRWIREGKLAAERRLGRGGSLVALKDIVEFVNLPPQTYVKAMCDWLDNQGIPYQLTAGSSDSGRYLATGVGLLTGGLLGGGVAATAANLVKYPKIVLDDTVIETGVEEARLQKALPDPTEYADGDLTDRAIQTPEELPSEDNYEARIIEEQMKLIKLKQELARINAEISIAEGQIEYYRLMLK